MSLNKLMLPVFFLAALSGCTTLPPPMKYPPPPEVLMRPPLALRSLPLPQSSPTITNAAKKTQPK